MPTFPFWRHESEIPSSFHSSPDLSTTDFFSTFGGGWLPFMNSFPNNFSNLCGHCLVPKVAETLRDFVASQKKADSTQKRN